MLFPIIAVAHGAALLRRIRAEVSPVSKGVFQDTDFKNDHCELRKDKCRNSPNEARSFSVFGPKNDYAELSAMRADAAIRSSRSRSPIPTVSIIFSLFGGL